MRAGIRRACGALELGAITKPAAQRRRHRSAAERRRLELLEQLTTLEPAIAPLLPCMTAAESAMFVGAAPLDEPARRRALELEACGACTLAYQLSMAAAGRCSPVAGASTPATRLSDGRYGAEEPDPRTEARVA